MPKKTIIGEYKGHRFVAENTWFSGAKLFHNNELIATNNDWVAVDKDNALMSANVMIDGSE